MAKNDLSENSSDNKGHRPLRRWWLKFIIIIFLLAVGWYFLPIIRERLGVADRPEIGNATSSDWWAQVVHPQRLTGIGEQIKNSLTTGRREHIADYEIGLGSWEGVINNTDAWQNLMSSTASTTIDVWQKIKQNIPGL